MRFVLRFFGFATALASLLLISGSLAVGILLWHLSADLPDHAELARYEPAVTTRLHAADGRIAAAFLSAEDRHFYEHNDIDPNEPGLGPQLDRINRMQVGPYEIGLIYKAMRNLRRLNVEAGSALRLALGPIRIGGKTGTSEKVVGGAYSKEKVMTFFVGVAPIGEPRYLFLTILDELRGLAETFGFRTSGWNAVPVTRQVMGEALPLLGVHPWMVSAD